MNINAINSTTFSGKIKTTKNGNEYEKSNEGKKIMPLVAASFLTANIGAEAVMLKKSGLLDDTLEKFKQSDAQKNILDNIKKSLKENKKTAIISGAAILAILAAITVGVGAIFDAMINKTRRKDADKFAKTENVSENTNRGKKIGAGIGLAMGGYNLIKSMRAENMLSAAKGIPTESIEKILKYQKANKFIIAPLVLASYIADGAIYDYGVNKFREKLADKKTEQAE